MTHEPTPPILDEKIRNTSGEAILSPELMDMVAGMGNHEAKALTILFLAQAREPLASGKMDSGFHGFIGSSEWKPPGQAYQFCQKSLEPIGQVVRAQVKGQHGPTVGYELSDRGRRIGVPIAGLLSEWSVRYPDISLQTILGQTASTGATRAPQHRLQLIMELLSTPHETVAITDVVGPPRPEESKEAYHTRLSSIDSASRGLERSGLVKAERVIIKNERAYKITSSVYPETNPNAQKSDVVEGAYSFLRECAERGQDTFTFSECLAYVTELLQARIPQINPVDIRRRLSATLTGVHHHRGTSYHVIPGIERLETFNEGRHTKVALNDEHRAALEDLVDILLHVDAEDAAWLKHGNEMAAKISADEKVKGMLMDKAYRFSPAAQKQDSARTARELIGILKEAAKPLRAEEIRELYQAQYDRNVAPATLRILLGRMALDGEVVAADRQTDITRSRKHKYFSLPDPVTE